MQNHVQNNPMVIIPPFKTPAEVYAEVKQKAVEIRSELPRVYNNPMVTIPPLPDQIIDPFSLGLLKDYILALLPHSEKPMSIYQPPNMFRVPTDLEMVQSKILVACAEAHELYTNLTGEILYNY